MGALPTRVRYAVQALTLLARQGDFFCPAHWIAQEEGIPVRFLDIILTELRRAGVVEAARGMHGGYRLAVHPDSLSLLDILETMSVSIAPLRCLDEPATVCRDCRGRTPCRFRAYFEAGYLQQRTELAARRLSDMAQEPLFGWIVGDLGKEGPDILEDTEHLTQPGRTVAMPQKVTA